MEFNAFSQGVRPGGITISHEIVILICYMLKSAGEPVTPKQLYTALLKEELVNYFEIGEAIDNMIADGRIIESNGKYILTPLGEKAVETFGDELPRAVRERGAGTLNEMLKRLHREKDNKVDIEKTDDGYKVKLCIDDIGTELLDISMFMPTEEGCLKVKEEFLNDPMRIYKGVFALLTGDMDTVGELLPKCENKMPNSK